MGIKHVYIVCNGQRGKLASYKQRIKRPKVSTGTLNRIRNKKNIQCFYSEQSNIVHDKFCRYARTINEKNIRIVANFPEGDYTYCKVCGKVCIVRTSVKDKENLDKYMELYKNIRAETLYKFYVEKNAYTCWNKNSLIIFCDSDYWMIKTKDKGIVLYHNSYVLNGLNERVFTNDWHIQSPHRIKSVGTAIRAICEYTYNSYHSRSTLEKMYCRN